MARSSADYYRTHRLVAKNVRNWQSVHARAKQKPKLTRLILCIEVGSLTLTEKVYCRLLPILDSSACLET
jgi:hypothetical protein